MISDAFVAMRSDAGRFGDGLLGAFVSDASEAQAETRAAFARLAIAIQSIAGYHKNG